MRTSAFAVITKNKVVFRTLGTGFGVATRLTVIECLIAKSTLRFVAFCFVQPVPYVALDATLFVAFHTAFLSGAVFALSFLIKIVVTLAISALLHCAVVALLSVFDHALDTDHFIISGFGLHISIFAVTAVSVVDARSASQLSKRLQTILANSNASFLPIRTWFFQIIGVFPALLHFESREGNNIENNDVNNREDEYVHNIAGQFMFLIPAKVSLHLSLL